MPSFLAYQSGQYKPLDEVTIALNDAGFVYGATVTDQCRTYGQKLFRLDDHLRRFREGCESCCIYIPTSSADWTDIIHNLLKRNQPLASPNTEWTIVLLATPGKLSYLLGNFESSTELEPQVIIYCIPLQLDRFRHFFQKGAEVRIATGIHRSAEEVFLRRTKHRSRLLWWVAEQLVRIESGSRAAQALLLELDGSVSETYSANLLLVKDGVVKCPAPARMFPRILYGVSLQVTDKVCLQLNIPFARTKLQESDLATADEALLCSTPYGIAPIGNLNGRQLPVNGPVFERLLAAWNELVGLDIRQQFLSAST